MRKSSRAAATLFAALLTSGALAGAAMAQDTVERCDELVTKLENKVKDKKLEGAALDKANAFLMKMKGHCAAQQFIEAGAAGLDVMIEIDRATG